MIAVIYPKVVIVYKPMGRETGLAKCLKVFFFFFAFFFDSCCCCFMLFFHWLLIGDKKAIPWDGWVFNVAIANLFTIKSLLYTWRARFFERWLSLTQD